MGDFFLDASVAIREPTMLFKRGNDYIGTLLFFPSKIQSIEFWDEPDGYRSFTDYSMVSFLQEEGKSLLIVHSEALPFLTDEEIYKKPNAPDSYPSTHDGKHWILHSESGLFHKKQILITYEHKEPWTGYNPEPNIEKLATTKIKLAEGKRVDLFILGDSISTGCNCSASMDLMPMNKDYGRLLVDLLNEQYHAEIHLKNDAVGGTTAKWGKNQVKTSIKSNSSSHFDLNIIAFGVNDSGARVPAQKYLRNLLKITKTIRKKNSKAEFIIISPPFVNDIWINSHPDYISDYRRVLKAYCGTAPCLEFADITQVWGELLSKKNFYDLTGNGINHPNDFGHVLYANTLAKLLSPGKILKDLFS